MFRLEVNGKELAQDDDIEVLRQMVMSDELASYSIKEGTKTVEERAPAPVIIEVPHADPVEDMMNNIQTPVLELMARLWGQLQGKGMSVEEFRAAVKTWK